MIREASLLVPMGGSAFELAAAQFRERPKRCCYTLKMQFFSRRQVGVVTHLK